MKGGDHGVLGYASHHAVSDRRRCRDAQGMAVQTAFAKKIAGSQNCDDGFFSVLGRDGELDLAFLEVKDRVCHVSLCENDLILLIFGYLLSLAHFGEKYSWIKRGLSRLPHKRPLFLLGPCVGPTSQLQV